MLRSLVGSEMCIRDRNNTLPSYHIALLDTRNWFTHRTVFHRFLASSSRSFPVQGRCYSSSLNYMIYPSLFSCYRGGSRAICMIYTAGQVCRVGPVLPQIMHNISQRQVRIYLICLIYLIYLICLICLICPRCELLVGFKLLCEAGSVSH